MIREHDIVRDSLSSLGIRCQRQGRERNYDCAQELLEGAPSREHNDPQATLQHRDFVVILTFS